MDYTIRAYLWCSNCTYTSSRNDNNIILPLVIPAGSTSVRLNELLSNLGNWETMVGSHCNMCNADGAVYQTHQELFAVSEFLVIQLKVYVFGDDGSLHKLCISVRDVTSSSIAVQGHRYQVQNIVSHQWRRKLLKTRGADHAVNLVSMHVRTTAWTNNSSLSL